MKINNKFNIGETVMFGINEAKITSITIYPNGSLVYRLSYLDKENKYIANEVYDFEINKYDKDKFGFRFRK